MDGPASWRGNGVCGGDAIRTPQGGEFRRALGGARCCRGAFRVSARGLAGSYRVGYRMRTLKPHPQLDPIVGRVDQILLGAEVVAQEQLNLICSSSPRGPLRQLANRRKTMGNIGSQNDLTSGRCGQQAKEPYGRCRAGICFASSYWGPSERSIHISGICCKVQQLYSLVHSTSSVRFLPFDICQNVAA